MDIVELVLYMFQSSLTDPEFKIFLKMIVQVPVSPTTFS